MTLSTAALLLCWPVARADTGVAPADMPCWEAPPEEGALSAVPRGSAAVAPDRLPVRTKVTVDYVYTAGPGGLGPGDGVRIEDPILHGMRWSKYGISGLSPGGCTPLAATGASTSLVTVRSEGQVLLGLARNREDAAIHGYAYTDVWVEQGWLEEGERILVRYGDTSVNPDCGQQTPDRAFTGVAWRAFEAVGGAFAELVAPTFDVLADPHPVALHAVLPSYAVAGEPLRLRVALLDDLGNPVPAAGLHGAVEPAYGGAALDFGPDNPGWLAVGLTLDAPGVHRVGLTAGSLSAATNPVVVLEEEPDLRLYWGDLHAHHGHTVVQGDGRLLDENHAYARDVAGLEVGCEAMKLPPVELGGEALWDELRRTCEEVTEDGLYVDLLGFEWMGGVRDAGHHNVYFDDCDGFLADHADIGGLGGEDGLLSLVAAWEAQAGGRAVVLPHASAYTGADWSVKDVQHRTAAEVFSGWGHSLDIAAEGSVGSALGRGQHLAFFASSDNHDGWLGNPRAMDGAPAGLAAFWAPALTRADVFEALLERQVYATTGARMVVEAWLETGGERLPAGPWVVSDDPLFGWKLHGTAPIVRVALRGLHPAHGGRAVDLLVEEPHTLDASGTWSMASWHGQEWAVWLQVDQEDGQRAWSSPFWVTGSCDREGRLDPAGLCAATRPALLDEGCGGCASAPSSGALAAWWAALGGLISCRRPSRAGRRRSR